MDHSEAQQSHAADRYVLSDMSGGERESFEEHFFDCGVCAAEVVEGAKFAAAGRRVALESPIVVPMPRRWTAWMPAAAAAVLVIIAAGIVVPRRSSPSLELAREYSVEFDTSRGASQLAPLTIDAKNPIIYVIVPDATRFPRYEIVLRDSERRDQASMFVTAEQATDQIPLLPRSLPAGSYVLAIECVSVDGNHTEIATREVTVR